MMPKVGSKEFGYDAKGKAAAKRESAKTGTPMKYGKPATPGKGFGQSLKGLGRAGKGKGTAKRASK